MAGRWCRRKTGSADWLSPLGNWRGAGLLVVEVGDGLADGAFVQHGLLVDHAGHQRGGADLVDATRQAFGVLEDAAECVVGKERPREVAGHADVVADVGDGFGQVERAEMVADAEALVEGFMHRQLQGATQLRDGRRAGAWPGSGCPSGRSRVNAAVRASAG